MKLAIIALVVAAQGGRALAGPTAEDLYSEGKAAYDHAHYATAIVKWQASYKLSGATGLLFNLAQAYRLEGDCKEALSTYQRFVAIDPKAEKRPLADDLIRELEPKCGGPTPPPTPTPTPTPAPAPVVDLPTAKPGRTTKLAGLVTGGTGVLLFAIGLGFGHRASTLGNEVTGACSTSCPWSIEQPIDAEGHHDAALGVTFDIVGALAIVAGAGLYYLGDREREIHVAPIATRSGEAGAVLSWSKTW